MRPSILESHAATKIVPLTVDQYHRMIAAAILPEGEPIELIDGLLVRTDRSAVGADPMTVGHAHSLVVTKLQNIANRLNSPNSHIRSQNPITLAPEHEPEPDGVIARGVPDDYAGHHPGPTDVLCVIEVAETSLAYDRTTKQRIYADAGIPQYVVVNIPDRQIEVYEQPVAGEGRYASKVVVKSGASVRINLGPEPRLEIAVDELLP
jgi:Uma2 family endonuclease